MTISPHSNGLSPRGRGKHLTPAPPHGNKGSIPAWAGETWSRATLHQKTVVYPRVGGGNRVGGDHWGLGYGLSPRGRGKLGNAICGGTGTRSIPAWAGETPPYPQPLGEPRVYPRVGGGNVRQEWERRIVQGLSPRGRGKPDTAVNRLIRQWSIPAWAGETPAAEPVITCGGVYPRVGGGNLYLLGAAQNPPGLSPRGRGKRVDAHSG